MTFEVVVDEDGLQQTFESRVSPMPNRQVIVLVRDVTEHRVAEAARRDLVAEVEQRRAHDQIRKGLERQTRLEAFGRLAGGVAHDINNLLGVIGNYAAVVERSVTDPATVQDVREIDAAVRRGSALTRRLLMFGQRDQAVSEVHDLVEIVEELAGMLRRAFEPDHRLVVTLPDGPCPVRVDRDQVGQALINLIVNAADASPVGSDVHVGVGPPADDPDGDWVELTVTDHGFGMTAEVRDRAFEPFFTTKDQRVGTGLGLSIVHGVAVDSGGAVEIGSPVEGGTVVRMRLPAGGHGSRRRLSSLQRSRSTSRPSGCWWWTTTRTRSARRPACSVRRASSSTSPPRRPRRWPGSEPGTRTGAFVRPGPMWCSPTS